jgi:hypothetical protein
MSDLDRVRETYDAWNDGNVDRLDAPGYHLIRFEGGRVRRYRTFRTREQALEAAESA